jgi:hypothetical protein
LKYNLLAHMYDLPEYMFGKIIDNYCATKMIFLTSLKDLVLKGPVNIEFHPEMSLSVDCTLQALVEGGQSMSVQ